MMPSKFRMRTFSALALVIGAMGFSHTVSAATIDKTMCVRSQNRTMSDGQSITFWGFTDNCTNTTPRIPGPPVEIGIGDTLNLTLRLMEMPMLAPMEGAPYMGHTIHLHGADVATSEDGVPETGAALMGDTYTWTPTSVMGGSYMYHCHQHTVKHLEMGMYGPMIVRPRDTTGNGFLNQLTPNSNTSYAVEQTFLVSTIDPRYHEATAVGDSTVFADYNPAYFLINGNEGRTNSTPAFTLNAQRNSRVAFRVIGLHGVHGTFRIRNSGGTDQQFTVYVQDGREYATPENKTSIDVGPGQRFDIIFTTPNEGGTLFPQFQFKRLRDGSVYTNGTAFSRLTF